MHGTGESVTEVVREGARHSDLRLANQGFSVFKRALELAAWPVLLSLVVTPVRVFLELAGVPTVFVFPLGLLWLAVGFGIFLGTRLDEERHPYMLLLLSLVVFSPPSRILVFVMWWVDTTWELGTHYGIFDSWGQALFSQLFWGSVIQVVPSFLVGALILGFRRTRARAA